MIELGHVTDRKPPFRYAAYTRVGFSDTDAQAVVYYGRYLPYFDVARTEYHRHLGAIDIRGEFAMRACAVEYHAPARFDDLLEVFVRIDRIGPDERHLRPRRLPARRRRARPADGDREADDRADRPGRPAARPVPDSLPRASHRVRGARRMSAAAIEAVDRILRRREATPTTSSGRSSTRSWRAALLVRLDPLQRGRRARPGPAGRRARPRRPRRACRCCSTPTTSPISSRTAATTPRSSTGSRRDLAPLPRRLGHRRRRLGLGQLTGETRRRPSGSGTRTARRAPRPPRRSAPGEPAARRRAAEPRS